MACQATCNFPTLMGMLRPKVYEFRIELLNILPTIWRRIQVPSDYGFFALHSAIRDTLGWAGLCLYRFQSFSSQPGVAHIELPLVDGVPCYEQDCLLTYGFCRVGDTATYVYRDNWRFLVSLERIFDQSVGDGYPVCVDGARGCPSEKIGSLIDYQYNLRVAGDPTDLLQSLCANFLSILGHTADFNPQSIVFNDPKELFRLVSATRRRRRF